MILRKKN